MTDWNHCTVFFPKPLITGELASGPLMKRKAQDGTWEYRRPTEDEEDDYLEMTMGW